MQELLAYALLSWVISQLFWFDATVCSMLALDGIERCVGVRPVLLAASNVLMLCVLKQRLFSLLCVCNGSRHGYHAKMLLRPDNISYAA